MNLCKDCKHVARDGVEHEPHYWRCGITTVISPMDGSITQRYCKIERQYSTEAGRCGVEGKNFEART